ncbi:MAG: polyprenyl synthetase family protein, partial [Candidatus Puniceispirillaceae bacterium]
MSETQIASLDRLTQALADEMPEVNQIILARMESEVPLIPQLAGHLIAAGGKRLRPLI